MLKELQQRYLLDAKTSRTDRVAKRSPVDTTNAGKCFYLFSPYCDIFTATKCDAQFMESLYDEGRGYEFNNH